MDLKFELISLLEKAKASEEYFNPFLLDLIFAALLEVYGDNSVDDSLIKWASNMYSR